MMSPLAASNKPVSHSNRDRPFPDGLMRMKVVYLNAAASLGGAERSLLHMLTSLRATAPETSLTLITAEQGPLLLRAEALGVRTMVVPMAPVLIRIGESHLPAGGGWNTWLSLARQIGPGLPALAGYLLRLRRALTDLQPDIIHSKSIKTHLLAGWARPGRVPVIWHAHDFFGQRPLSAQLLRHARRGLVGAIGISAAVADDLRALLPGIPVATILNAIDVHEFDRPGVAPADLDRLAGLPPAPPGTVRVGMIATYARWKGQDLLLRAMARLRAARPDLPVRVYIVGGPIYMTQAQWSREELRALAARLPNARDVGFIDFQAETATVYAGLDVVVHASTRPEPFGLMIIEAMAGGKAVVVTQAGGAAELFTQDVDAIGFPLGDEAALAAAIERLAGDPALRRTLGETARQTARTRFDRARLGAQLLEAYGAFLKVASR
jgi:glycosyltransferase involved in cell wall biosynthesis